jgi:hypothetical protein
MRETYCLQQINIPENKHLEPDYHNLPRCPVFMSTDFLQETSSLNNGKKALILIQGTGAVRAGIWARSVCINENLEKGSMLPFIDKCRELGIAVLVMNPNYTRCPETGSVIPYAHTMSDHAVFVWKNYVLNSGFTEIYVVAHSAGGGCLASIQREFASTFYD